MSKDEIKKKQYAFELPEDMIESLEKYSELVGGSPSEVVEELLDEFLEDKYEMKYDPLIDDIIEDVIKFETYSTAHLQRRFVFGYNRAQKVLSQLVELGYLEQRDDHKPRKVLKNKLLQ